MTVNDPDWTDNPAPPRTTPIDQMPRVALHMLSHAYACARDAGADLWNFALEIDTLFQAGLTISDLRWLVARGFVEHGQELSVYGDAQRSFRRGDGFFFQHPTCVILTPKGAAFLDRLLREPVEFPPSVQPIETTPRMAGATAGPDDRPAATTDPECTIHGPGKPFWDGVRRELCLDGQVVKRFRVPARNQEVILGAFEEERWPHHIDDPLPVRGEMDPCTRLHDAINRLNRCQIHRLLRFHGNGTGKVISWSRFQAATSYRTRIRATQR